MKGKAGAHLMKMKIRAQKNPAAIGKGYRHIWQGFDNGMQACQLITILLCRFYIRTGQMADNAGKRQIRPCHRGNILCAEAKARHTGINVNMEGRQAALRCGSCFAEKL